MGVLLESRPGTYVLWLRLDDTRTVRVGKLGLRGFEAGVYAYVGSALGAGGIRARLGRHLRSGKKKRWHIDYLRDVSQVQLAWVSYDPGRQEHHWAHVLSRLADARLPVPRFGASDCDCDSHLAWFPRPPSLRTFLGKAGLVVSSVKEIQLFEQ